MPISVFLFVLFVATITCKKQESSTVITCENDTANLQCPDGDVITVLQSSYGRSNYDVCPHPSIQTNECAASTSVSKVKSLCEGQQTCSLKASNSVFGDPCVRTYKYLNVTYSCQKAPKSGQLIVCEGKTLNLQCQKNKYIKINTATYGRTDRITCPDPRIRTTECSTDTPLSVVKNQCEGQQSCTVSANNGLYGDPCVGTYKYLTVDYKCTGKGNAGKPGTQ